MSDQNLDRLLNEGLNSTALDSGVIWETFPADQSIVQAPNTGDEWRIEKAVALYNHLEVEGVNLPELKRFNLTGPAYMAFENVGDRMLQDLRKNIENNGNRENYLQLINESGKELALIHNATGQGYGYPDPVDKCLKGDYDSWNTFVEDEIEYIEGFTEEGRFEEACENAVDVINIETLPKYPESSVLHNDYSDDNLIIQEDTVVVIDLDNAVLGDSRYGFMNSMATLCRDKESRESFRQGYESERELNMSKDLKRTYEAFSIIESTKAGEWIERNRGGANEDWVSYLNKKAKTI